MHLSAFPSAACAVFLLATASSAATTVTFDFESGLPTEFSGAGAVESVAGLSGFNGFDGSFLRNTTVPGAASLVSLTGLGAHSEVTVSFGLALIDSWDGLSGGSAADYFNMLADGSEEFEISVGFPGRAGNVESVPSTATNRTNFGTSVVGSGGFRDTSFDVSMTFAHSGATLDLSFFADGSGWQGGTDESWGIDNLTVSYEASPVPLPAGGLLLLTGLAGFGISRRRS